MPFEIQNVLWTPIEVIPEELNPILSQVSDSLLGEQTVKGVGLEKARVGLMDPPFSRCFDFKHGRMVQATAIDLAVVGEVLRSEANLTNWFMAGESLVRLLVGTQQTCGGVREQAEAQIFGPPQQLRHPQD